MDQVLLEHLKDVCSDKNYSGLDQFYEKLRHGRKLVSPDFPEQFSPEIFVLCAEVAVKASNKKIASECLKLYFSSSPPTNQFLCRAYFCQAELDAPQNSTECEKLTKASAIIIKAINHAKQSSRHHFLIYNASVCFWSFARQFNQNGFRNELTKWLHIIVKSLEEIDDEDASWRCQLMIALIECHVESKSKEDALHVSQSALRLAKSECPELIKPIFGLLVKYKLDDPSKSMREMKLPYHILLYHKILNLKINGLTSSDSSPDTLSTLKTLFDSIVGSSSLSPVASNKQSKHNSKMSTQKLDVKERISLLLDLSNLGLQTKHYPIVQQCLGAIDTNQMNDSQRFEFKIIECDMLASTISKKSTFNQQSIKKRCQIISQLDEIILHSIYLDEPNLIQIACCTMWNICLPLVQPRLRSHIRNALSLIARLFEEHQCLLYDLRCQVHFELSKCLEDEEQTDLAIEHLHKAVTLDVNGVNRVRIQTNLKRLGLRSDLYHVPDDPYDYAVMVIEQARSTENNSGKAMKRALLIKAGKALCPEAVSIAMDAEASLAASRQSSPLTPTQRVSSYDEARQTVIEHLVTNASDESRCHIFALLAKTARKEELWDVVRVACNICLFYGQQQSKCDHEIESDSKHESSKGSSRGSFHRNKSDQSIGCVDLNRNDTLRELADVHMIHAEAYIHLLKCEGFDLLQYPKENIPIPECHSSESIESSSDNPPEFSYDLWLQSISDKVIESYETAAEISEGLQDACFIYNIGTYIWNYTRHIKEKDQCDILVPLFSSIYQKMMQVNDKFNITSLCLTGCTLSRGLIQKSRQIKPETHPKSAGKERKGGAASNLKKMKSVAGVSIHVPPEALAVLEQAHKILEHLLSKTNGSDSKCIVSLDLRHEVIREFVACKLAMGSALPKTIGQENEGDPVIYSFSRAIFAVEALISRSRQPKLDIGNCPTIETAIGCVELCDGVDIRQLQSIWLSLASLCAENEKYERGEYCCNKFLDAKNSGSCKSESFENNDLKYTAFILKGQALSKRISLDHRINLSALECFSNACRCASKLQKVGLVEDAAKWFWNVCHPLKNMNCYRNQIIPHLESVVKDLCKVSNKVVKEKDAKCKTNSKLASPPKIKIDKRNENSSNHSITNFTINLKEKRDYTAEVKTALFTMLFHAYKEKGEYEKAINCIDNALKILPDSKEKLFLIQLRLPLIAALDKPVRYDIGKLKDCTPLYQVEAWICLARSSINLEDQQNAYEKCLTILSCANDLLNQSFVILEYAEWLCHKKLDGDSALGQLRDVEKKLLNAAKGVPDDSPSAAKQLLPNFQYISALIPVYVMMYKISKPTDAKNKLFLIYAANMVHVLWEFSLQRAEKFYRDGVKPGETTHGKRSGSHKKREAREHSKGEVKSYLPSNLDQWAQFKIPEKFIDYFIEDQSAQLISKTSIRNPIYLSHYLDQLFDGLVASHQHHMALPVCALLVHISDYMIDNTALKSLQHMRFTDLCEQLLLTCPQSKQFVNQEIVSIAEQARLKMTVQLNNNNGTREKNIKDKCQSNDDISIERLLTSRQSADDHVIPFRVWPKIANILIKMTCYGQARQLLELSHEAAKAANDETTLAVVLYNLGFMEYKMEQYYTALKYLEKCMNFNGLFETMYNALHLLLKTLETISEESQRRHPSQSFIGYFKAISIVEHYKDALKNRSDIPFGSSVMKAKLNSIHGNLLLGVASKCPNGKDSSVYLNRGLELLKMSYTNLLSLEHNIEAVKVMITYIERTQSVKTASGGIEDWNSDLLDLLDLAKSALHHIEFESTQSAALHPVDSKVISIHLPINKLFLETHLSCIDVMLDIMKIMVEYHRDSASSGKKKSTMEQIIEDYTGYKGEVSKEEQRWNDMTCTVPQEALMMLATVYAYSEKTPYLRACMLVKFGRCLSMLSILNSNGNFDVWNKSSFIVTPKLPDPMESLEDDKESTATTTDDAIPDEPDSTTDKQNDKSSNNKQPPDDTISFNQYMVQATEYLVQSINLCLKNGFADILADTCLALIETIGELDPSLTSWFLALYQSAIVSSQMETVLRDALGDTTKSQAAELISQKKQLEAILGKGIKNSMLDACRDSLTTNLSAWKRLQISTNFFDSMKDIQFPITFIILQHSPDKEYLYVTVLENKKASHASGKKKTQSSSAKPMIKRIKTDPNVLNSLLDLHSDYSKAMEKTLSFAKNKKDDEETSVCDDCNEDEINASKDSKSSTLSVLKGQFDDIRSAITAYLNDMMDDIEPYIASSNLPDNIVILADTDLLKLPLECLSIFSKCPSVSRDFSLQLFHHRIMQGRPESKSEKQKSSNSKRADAKGNDAKTANSKNDKQSSNLDSKKNTKKQKREYIVSKDGIQLDLSTLKYVIDPHKNFYQTAFEVEKSSTLIESNVSLIADDTHPMAVVDGIMSSMKNICGKWSGVTGNEVLPSCIDVFNILHDASALLYAGQGNILTSIPHFLLSQMSLSDCHLAVTVDLAGGIVEFPTSRKLEKKKSMVSCSLENPMKTAMLLSLTGVPCVIQNQWKDSLDSFKVFASQLFEGLILDGSSVGQCIAKSRTAAEACESVTGNSANQFNDMKTTVNDFPIADESLVSLSPGDYNFILYGLPMFKTVL